MRRLVDRTLVFLAASGVWLLVTGLAAAEDFDRVRTHSGAESGRVVGMDETKVTLSKGATEKEIPVNTIGEILFAREPGELTSARMSASTGGYQSALESLSRIDLADVERAEIREDIAFYAAYCRARLAIAGEGELLDAGKEIGRFMEKHRGNYHYLAAVEILGDVLVAMGRYDAAEKQYAALGKAPWPEYKLRATVLEGRALAAQGKHQEAIAKFDAALAMQSDAPAAQEQHLSATLGKAISLAAFDHVDEAVTMVTDVIARAEPEATRLHAESYNALGKCYLQADKKKDALLAFLHVDLLYNGYADAHAEALFHLVSLWQEFGQGERARKAKNLLTERYPHSRWANN